MISALTFNGINYLSGGSAKQFVSMDASWENNFRPGFFPGSGAQDGYQIQGRFEWGDRASRCSLWCACRPDRPSTRT
jgi:hypothetical protein